MVNFAFTCGGKNYYRMADVFNTFSHRALSGLSVYEKWNMRMTREFIAAHTLAFDNIINSKNVKLTDLVDLNNKMKERLNFPIPTEDIIWHFASVVFFDESESPYKYDEAYCKEKIKFWKSQEGMDTFFFKMPIKDLINIPEYSESDLKTILEVANLAGLNQINSLSDSLSQDQKKSASFSGLQYQKSLLSIGID